MDNRPTSEETPESELNFLVRHWEEAHRIGFKQGMEVGIEKGIKIGMEKVIARYMEEMPEDDDATIAQSFEWPIQAVAEIRATLSK